MRFKKKILFHLLTGLLAVMASCNSKPAEQAEASGDTAEATETQEDTTAVASPRKNAEGKIGDVEVTVDYGAPQVKGRKIWGGLEQYGEVWRAGANETTSFEFDKDVIIGGKVVEAGKYGFYLIPSEHEKWVAILNSDWDREKHGAWGAYNYNQANDVVRLNVEPEWPDDNQEMLKYTVTADGIELAWEKARVLIPVEPADKN